MHTASLIGPARMPGTLTHERTFALLHAIAMAGELGANLDELCAQTGGTPGSVFRLLQALSQQGFIRPAEERGRYVPGNHPFELDDQAGRAGGLRDRAGPALQHLVESFDDSFFLLVPDGHAVLRLEMQGGSQPLRGCGDMPGGRIPLGVGQGSQVLLAHMSRRDCREILSHNATTLRDDYGLEAEQVNASLPSVRRQGYACGLPDRSLPGYTGLAVPILDVSGRLLGALSCALSRLRPSVTRREALAAAMHAEAGRIVGSAPWAAGAAI